MSKSFFAKIALILTTLFWGSTFVVIKLIMNRVGPFFLIGVRFSIASILLAIFFHKRFKQMTKNTFFAGCIVGFNLWGGYVIQTMAIDGGEPGRTAFLGAFYCVLVPLFIWAIKGLRPSPNSLIAAVLCVIGIGVVSYTGGGAGAALSMADVLAILSGLFFAGHITSISLVGADKDPILIAIMQMAFAAIGSWILFFLFERQRPLILDGQAWMGMLYLSIACTLIALTLQVVGQQYTSPQSAAIIYSSECIFSVILAAVFYHEKFTIYNLVGFAIIFTGILVSEYRPRRKKRKQNKQAPLMESEQSI